MKKGKMVCLVALLLAVMVVFAGCELDSNTQDKLNTVKVSRKMAANQSTPTDIEYSLARYNLIRRAYFMAGYFEKARNLPCEVEKPLGYIYLFLEGVGCVLCDTVDGITTSMRSYLTPDTDYPNKTGADWLADVDGTYGDNPDGIFYFDASGMYHEWTGLYYYSDTYYDINDPIIQVKMQNEMEAAK